MRVTLKDGTVSKINLEGFQEINLLGFELHDLNTISLSLFFIEDFSIEEIKEVAIPLEKEYDDTLRTNLEEVLFYVFQKEIKITFYPAPQRRLFYKNAILQNRYTCLFSGGIDSFAGILNAKKEFTDVIGSFSSHKDQSYLKRIITSLKNNFLGVDVHIFNNPRHGTRIRYLRGIKYLFDALLLSRTNIIISECGPTMYQPRFAPLDDVTFTTNPQLLEYAKEIAKIVLNSKIKLIKPNENLTKAEIIASCPQKNNIKHTHSCWTTRWQVQKNHEGSCYGCVTRNIATCVAGVEDNVYRHNVLTCKDNTNKQLINILALLDFSLRVLSDYESLPSYSRDIIDKNKKQNLFKRFSMDNFSALYLLKERKELRDPLLIKYLERAKKYLSKDTIQNRIEEVRACRYTPNFH